MANPAFLSSSLPRAALAGATALMLLCSPMAIDAAAAKVGVTSATDGDPLAKPPTGTERVLRVGVDVQANETITTKAGDRAHLMFLDGTSLTVGPDANLVIDRFVYDPQTKTGDLAITASKGVFRLVGGKISKTNAIVVTTPSDTIGIRGGIAIFNVEPRKTISVFIFGISMTIGANGRVEIITRAGTVVTTLFGGGPGLPRLVGKGELAGQLSQLEGSKQGGSQGGNTDQSAQNSGFSKTNSGKGTTVDGSKGDKFGSGPGPRNRNPSDQTINAITQPESVRFPDQVQQTNVVAITNTMTSTISYKGGMTGLVNNSGNVSLKSGVYQNVWNVGQRMGAVTATFDGATYGNGSLNTRVVGNGPAFVTPTPLPSVTGPAGRSLSLAGTFTGSGGVPTSPASPGNQVGVFAVTGNNYGSVGVFNGRKQ